MIPDAGSPLGLYAYTGAAGATDSVAIDAAGEFSLPLRTDACGPAELRIDVPPGIERRYHPAIVHVDRSATVRVLLVPVRVVIDGGTYAGMTIPIEVDDAFSAAAGRVRFWRVSRSPREGYGTPVGWPETFFPIPVALRARDGIRPADSASFWRAARQLEADLGRALFEPAADEPAPEEIWKIVVMIEPRTRAAAITFATYDSFGAIYEAAIAVSSAARLGDAGLVTHELMHALGFGHATAWHSATMTSRPAPARLTSTDVGYAQLFYQLRRAHIAQAATHGVLASSGTSPAPARGRTSEMFVSETTGGALSGALAGNAFVSERASRCVR